MHRHHGRIVFVLVIVVLIAFLLINGGPHVAEPNDLPAGVAWKKVFSDGFNAPQLDRKKWTPSRYNQHSNEGPYNPDKERAFYTESGVTVSSGQAHMTVKSVPNWILINGKYYGLSSGVMTTRDSFAMKPGDFAQARLRVPKGDGLWPAFWATAADGSWPPEMDFFEFFDTNIDSRPYFSYLNQAGEWSGPSQYGDMLTDYRGAFHVYGIYWRPDGMLIPYIDGIARPEVGKHADTTKPMFIILNLAVQEGHNPKLGSHFDADWVRVYRP